MRNILKKTGIILGTLLMFCPSLVNGQVLESMPDNDYLTKIEDNEENGALPEFHLGATMSGTSGLVTIPTPDYNEKTEFSISAKHSNTDFDMKINGEKITNTKNENIVSMKYNPTPEMELSVTNLHYKRTNNANIRSLESNDDLVAGGIKYTAGNDGKNYCFGFNFAPISAEDMNNLDIEQLENMRNIYFTFSDEINDKLCTYFNVGTSFTKDQTIEVAPGNNIEIGKKNIVYGGIGVEYQLVKGISLFGEFKVANYRDFEAYQDKPNRHRAHIGARFGNENFQVECIGMNVTGDNPGLVLGGNIGF